eukprot:scaffold18950_cov122-Isochrysis_galbana.AAC.2
MGLLSATPLAGKTHMTLQREQWHALYVILGGFASYFGARVQRSWAAFVAARATHAGVTFDALWLSLAMLAQSQRRRPPTSTSHERLVVVCHENSASAWRSTMAARRLRLELNVVDMTADKGSQRVRESALNAQTRAQCRYDSMPERPPVAPPGHALRTAGIA